MSIQKVLLIDISFFFRDIPVKIPVKTHKKTRYRLLELPVKKTEPRTNP